MDNCVFFVLVIVCCCFLPNFSVGLSFKQSDEEPDIRGAPGNRELWMTFADGHTENILNEGFQNATATLFLIDRKKLHWSFIRTANCSKVMSDLKDHIVKVKALAAALNPYSKNPNIIERVQNFSACKNYRMQNTIDWIHREITGTIRPLTLYTHMEGMNNRQEVLVLSNLVVFTFIKASILGDACLSTSHANMRHLNKTRGIYGNVARRYLRDVVSTIKNYFESEFNKTNWREEAKSYVFNYTKEHVRQHQIDLFNTIYRYLTETYFWRNWLVASIHDTSLSEFTYYAEVQFDQGFYTFKKYFDRHFFVMSPDILHRNHGMEKFDECFDTHWEQPRSCHLNCSCFQMLSELRNCYNPTNCVGFYKGFLCIKNGVGLLVKATAPLHRSYFLDFYKKDVTMTTKEFHPNEGVSHFDFIVVP